MEQRLCDRVILVTGSTTGVGEAAARRCVAEGAQVMVHGRQEERAQAVCADLGAAARYTICDLGEPAGCARLVAATIEQFGRLDGVVNNAALTTRSNLESTDTAFFDRMIAVNLRAPLLIIRAAVPEFRKHGRGVVVNIGSINGLAGEENLLAYSISKGGLTTLTRNLANALAAERIRINQLSLGWVATPNEIALKQREGLAPGWEKNVPRLFAPIGRLLAPEEAAAHIAYWLSDDSAPANGVVYELEQYSPIGRNVSKAF
ncbi:MAG: SDR family oxidoreductase [Caldilineaceae bacterium]|nr:SDR family oxidoreductase [Caldilineaceae bacterium]